MEKDAVIKNRIRAYNQYIADLENKLLFYQAFCIVETCTIIVLFVKLGLSA